MLAFRKLQKLHDDWRETGPVAKEYREEIWNRFKKASSAINKKHQEFFERLKTEESENLAQKTTLCEAVEAIDYAALKTHKDWEAKTEEIKQYQEQWKTIGFAPRKMNNKVYERFRKACDTFFAQKSEFFKSIKENQLQNLEKKRQLCEKAEALMNSTDWKNTTEAFIEMQREWKTIGPVPRKFSDTIWKRFITACDYFFAQKEKENPSHRQEEANNLAVKKELIEKMDSS